MKYWIDYQKKYGMDGKKKYGMPSQGCHPRDGLSKEIWDGLSKEIWDGLLKDIRSKPCSSVSFPFCQAQSFHEQIASNKNESGLCPSLDKTIKLIYLQCKLCMRLPLKKTKWLNSGEEQNLGNQNENAALYNIHIKFHITTSGWYFAWYLNGWL